LRKKPAYKVAPSPIHGKGLFATRRIRKGDPIGRYTGRSCSKDMESNDNTYVIYRCNHDGRIKDARLGTGDLRFINHSDRPNVDMDWYSWEFFATRDIEPGEEILWSYGEEWD